MNDAHFHLRYETKRLPDGGLFERKVPPRVVSGLVNIMDTALSPSIRWWDYYREIRLALDERVIDNYLNSGDSFRKFLQDLPWDEFCTAIDIIVSHHGDSPRRDGMINEVNALFRRQYFAYEIRNGRVERVGARIQEESIGSARIILRNPELQPVDEAFQKAIGHYQRRPEPDWDNAVKDAVGAIEGLARILTAHPKEVLSDQIKIIQREKGIDPLLAEMLQKLYAYRGNKPGVGHGKAVGTGTTPEEAEFVMGTSASAIVYLARLYGRDVVS